MNSSNIKNIKGLIIPMHHIGRLKQLFIIIAIPFLINSHCYSQDADVVMDQATTESLEITATNTITLKAGFQTYPGTSFKAKIVTAQTSGGTTTINSTSSSTTVSSGTSSMNYIKAITYQQAETSVPATGTSFLFNEDIQYFDGLGRPIQTVQVGASPDKEDIIVPNFYDAYGREAIKAMPYTSSSNTGEYRSDATIANINSYYYTTLGLGDSVAYNKTVFENSPLNRPTKQYGPGLDWKTNDKYVSINYLSNDAEEPGWEVTGAYTYSSVSYPIGSLYVTETIDEQGNKTQEYKDKEGQVVCKKTYDGTNWLKTSYIYDDHGLLRCVVPPLASSPDNKKLCYYYLYDSRNRMITKTVPGADSVNMVYDKRDRLRCTQNGVQRLSNNSWSYTKYDELNRPVITGVIEGVAGNIQSAIDAASMNESWDGTKTYKGYTSVSYPTSGTIQTATYYDNYNFISALSLGDSLNYEKYTDVYSNLSLKDATPTGMVTGTYTLVLMKESNSAIKQDLYSANYYDKYGHVLRAISTNHLGGKDVLSNKYEDITYLVKQSRQEHFKGSEHIVIDLTMEYDHRGRLLATQQKINSQDPITLSASAYNKIGQMTVKYLHSKQISGDRSFLQKIDYGYNIRGWLTSINDPELSSDNDLFGMKLSYNKAESGLTNFSPTTLNYNGNISAIRWKNYNGTQRAYTFDYDKLNRLKKANYAEGSSLTDNIGANNEEITSYDNNGNILGLTRMFNDSTVDNLTYKYLNLTNQIDEITDAGTDNVSVHDYRHKGKYTYDLNGNMLEDGGRGNSLEYFSTLNLPMQVDFGNGANINYDYTATGSKLVKKTAIGTNSNYTHYIGNIIYEDGKLSYIITPEGRMVASGEGSNRVFLYEYDLKDHLGNTRVTFRPGETSGVKVMQTNSYYPFGLTMYQNILDDNSYSENKYLYNGKELQNETLNGKFFGMYDYGARFYDPQVGRWHSSDPKAESYESISPYSYAFNNPIRFIDYLGKDPGDVVVIFAGADFASNGGLGSTGSIVSGVRQGHIDQRGGAIQNFSSPYWRVENHYTPYGPALSFQRETDLDNATQAAYDYIKENYKNGGKISIYGYSYGGVLANHIAKRLEEDGIKVDQMIIVDAAMGPENDKVDRTIPDNVENCITYYQTESSSVGSHGDKSKRKDGSEKGINNTIKISYKDNKGKTHKIVHDNIDEATLKDVINSILKELNEK